MDQNTVHLVVPADALTPIHTLLDTHGVGGLIVGAGHLVQPVVHEAEGGSIHHGGDVDTVGLQRLEQVGQLGQQGMPSNITRYFSGKEWWWCLP